MAPVRGWNGLSSGPAWKWSRLYLFNYICPKLPTERRDNEETFSNVFQTYLLKTFTAMKALAYYE